MLAAVVESPGVDVRLVEVEPPSPGPGEVVIEVAASGICHTDLDIMAGRYPFARFPLVPGHEVAGVVAERGAGVVWPELGALVGLPWCYSSCGHCELCDRGDFNLCGAGLVTGATAPGGYQERVLALADYVIPAPVNLDVVRLAPLMCSGLTAFTGLSQVGPVNGQRVAVLGLGAVGEYVTWYAATMGARVAVVSGSAAKGDLAQRLGAEVFVDRRTGDAVEALLGWEGGVHVVISTVPDSELPSRMPACILPGGKLVVLGIGDTPLTFECHSIVDRRIAVLGTSCGAAKEARGTLAMAASGRGSPRATVVPLRDIKRALELARTGVNGKIVLDMRANGSLVR